MSRFVAFLRGINVGEHRVTKEQLLEAFKRAGVEGAATFRQSGNVIFEIPEDNSQELAPKIEATLKDVLGYDVSVFIRSINELKSMLKLDTFKGQNKEGASFLVTFLAQASDFPLPLPATIPKSTALVVKILGREVYSVTHGGGEGALPNHFVEVKLKTKATTRNINVLMEIANKYALTLKQN